MFRWSQCHFSIFFDQQFQYNFWWNTELSKCSTFHKHLNSIHATLCCFLNWKFISSLRCEGHYQKYNCIASHYIKRSFRGASTKWKTQWNEWVEFLGNYFEENLFPSLFINVFINYSFSLHTFWTHLVYKHTHTQIHIPHTHTHTQCTVTNTHSLSLSLSLIYIHTYIYVYIYIYIYCVCVCVCIYTHFLMLLLPSYYMLSIPSPSPSLSLLLFTVASTFSPFIHSEESVCDLPGL